MKRIKLLITVLLFAISSSFAQFSNLNNYVTRIWTLSDGFPVNTATDIIQSNNGYIYIGTYEGLVKFDGFDFQVLNRYANEKYDFFSSRTVFQDSSGSYWIGTNEDGLVKITSGQTVKFNTENGLPGNSIRSIVEDKYHNVWVGTSAGVVYITPGNSIVHPPVTEEVDFDTLVVSQLYCDTAGRIWLVPEETKSGLYLCSGDSFQRFKGLDSFGAYTVTAMTQDLNGTFWIALTEHGLVKLTNNEVTRVTSGTSLDTVKTNSIYCDSTGSVWLGGEYGIILYRDGEFSAYIQQDSLASANINKVIGDREGNIWFATDGQGIAKISPGKFRMTKLETKVNAICEDEEGLVWVGADNGLLCYDNEIPVSNELTEFSKDLRIRHVGITSDGDILVNAYSKPAQILYTKEGIKTWSTDDGLAGDKTRVSISGSDGNLYVGTTTGLSVINKDGSIRNYDKTNGLKCEYVMCLFEDTDGIIWIGTDGGGIYFLQNEAIVNVLNTSNGLAGNVVFKIIKDKNCIYWVCTGSGISRIDAKNGAFIKASNIQNYNKMHGIGTDSIFQMVMDPTNKCWLTSNKGISSVEFRDFSKLAAGEISSVDAKNYNQNDGLKTNGINSTSLSMCDKYGRLWFTLVDGFAVFDSLKVQTNNLPPLVNIEKVTVDEKVYEYFDEPIIIPPGAKHIDIKYTGLSFTASERIRFTYKLEGFDSNFSNYTANRLVSYTNLKPGTYTFHLNAVIDDGMPSDKPVSVMLVQKPLFYQKTIFWVSCIIFITGLVFLIIFLQNRSAQIKQLKLETQIQMKTVELEMAKDESDRLLKNILPDSIAERLKSTGMGAYETIAESYESVTVLFSDIVGFTKTTSSATADDIVNSLNDLFSRFDDRARRMGVEKIKTIGDAYMAACGVPKPDPHHAEKMISFARGMYKDLAEYNKTAKIKFNIRVGLNTGPVIAGVIGKNKFIYDMWGDTVNVASRMESLCKPGSIRMTTSVREALEKARVINSVEEQDCEVKGKGLMKTFEVDV